MDKAIRTKEAPATQAPSQDSTEISRQRSPEALVARLDRLRATRYHFFWVAVLGVGYLVETFDNTVFGYLAPSIRAQWNLSLGDVGVLVSAVFYGMIAGGLVGGRLIDRFGRKPLIVWGSVLYAAASLLCAVAPNFDVLFAGRVLTGLGVQAVTGAVLVYASEMFPRLSRGRFVTAMVFFGSLGAPVTAFTAAAIAPTGPSAWRLVFGLGVVGVLIAILVAALLPETVRWLALNGQDNKASNIVEKLEAAAARRGPLGEVHLLPAPTRAGAYRELFKPVYARRLVVASLTFAAVMFCQYGFSAYLATVLVGSGLGQAEALHVSSIITLGVLLATPLLLIFADRIERKTAVLIATLLTGVGMVIFSSASGAVVLAIAGLVTYMGVSTLITSFYAFIPEQFPTEVRGVGTGFVNAVGRAAGIAAGLGVAALYGAMGLHLYLILAAIAIVAGIVAFTMGPRTSQRALENISPEEL